MYESFRFVTLALCACLFALPGCDARRGSAMILSSSDWVLGGTATYPRPSPPPGCHGRPPSQDRACAYAKSVCGECGLDVAKIHAQVKLPSVQRMLKYSPPPNAMRGRYFATRGGQRLVSQLLATSTVANKWKSAQCAHEALKCKTFAQDHEKKCMSFFATELRLWAIRENKRMPIIKNFEHAQKLDKSTSLRLAASQETKTKADQSMNRRAEAQNKAQAATRAAEAARNAKRAKDRQNRALHRKLREGQQKYTLKLSVAMRMPDKQKQKVMAYCYAECKIRKAAGETCACIDVPSALLLQERHRERVNAIMQAFRTELYKCIACVGRWGSRAQQWRNKRHFNKLLPPGWLRFAISRYRWNCKLRFYPVRACMRIANPAYDRNSLASRLSDTLQEVQGNRRSATSERDAEKLRQVIAALAAMPANNTEVDLTHEETLDQIVLKDKPQYVPAPTPTFKRVAHFVPPCLKCATDGTVDAETGRLKIVKRTPSRQGANVKGLCKAQPARIIGDVKTFCTELNGELRNATEVETKLQDSCFVELCRSGCAAEDGNADEGCLVHTNNEALDNFRNEPYDCWLSSEYTLNYRMPGSSEACMPLANPALDNTNGQVEPTATNPCDPCCLVQPDDGCVVAGSPSQVQELTPKARSGRFAGLPTCDKLIAVARDLQMSEVAYSCPVMANHPNSGESFGMIVQNDTSVYAKLPIGAAHAGRRAALAECAENPHAVGCAYQIQSFDDTFSLK